MRRNSLKMRRIGGTISAKDALNMVWIYENKEWPHFTWVLDKLAPKLSDLRHRQGRLLGRMESLGFDLRQEACLQTLTTDVVNSSAIEGEILDSEEVRSSIAQRLGIEIAGLVPVSRDVEGIVEILLDATQNSEKSLTAERLFNWHAALFPTGRSGMHKITVGDWRPISAGVMQVVSGPIGRETIHFQAPEACDLKKEMACFLNWFEADQGIDPVLKAGLSHFWFVTIHPFEDGNGRIARAIADMALSRADGLHERFYSMSTQIEKERKTYYEKLERQQRGGLDVTCWLDWFLDCLGRALEHSEILLQSVLFKADFWKQANQHGVNQRQRVILNRLLDGFKGHMTSSKYATLAKCSQDTALRDLSELKRFGLIIQNPGAGRSTSYRLPRANEFILLKST